MYKSILILICSFQFIFSVQAQTCTAAGQNPSTAFPVCGTNTFVQNNVPICGGRALPAPNCRNDGLKDVNPFWYKFTCFAAGTLGFEIEPNNLNDDYDWEIYDITGRNPDDVFIDGKLVISHNWSGEGGKTGASPTGNQPFVCGGFGKPLYSSMPTLQVGHNYLMLVSHYTQSQSGYKLSFKGGSAIITDSTLPKLKSVTASCGGDVLRLNIGKKIKCNSIAPNGSEFYITPNTASVSAATAAACSNQFDTDSISLQLSSFLPPGSYTLHIKKGSDNNTLLDYCDNSVSENEVLSFSVLPKTPTPIDSVAPITCAPKTLKIILSSPILCSSIAKDGSDFSVDGTYGVNIISAACSTGKEIIVTFSQPLEQAGTFVLNLKKGTDNNTIVNECGEETLPGPKVAFNIYDTVNAAFSYQIKYGCSIDDVQYLHAGSNGVNKWNWSLDDNLLSTLQNPKASYKLFNTKTVQLIVSNGFCSDTTNQKVELKNFLKADFAVYADNCPNEPINFTSTAVGQIINHQWSFGDGGSANTNNPVYTYKNVNKQTVYTINYTVTDSFNCVSTMSKPITVYASCYLAVPSAFTPNGDGLNDFLYPLNAVKAEQLQFQVFNRWGRKIFSTVNWKRGWDGKVEGVPQSMGTYVWTLTYTDRDSKKILHTKGTVVLIR